MDYLKLAKEKLSPNNLENGLPGRETQDEEIFQFLFERLRIRQTTSQKKARVDAGLVADIKGRHMNKTMFVCGVPGTGKTATINCAVYKLAKLLEKKPCPIHDFQAVYINGQHLSAPNKVYTEILYKLTGETISAERAQERLDSIFRQEPSIHGATTRISQPIGKRTKIIENKNHLRGYTIVIIDELDLLYNDKRDTVFYSLFDWPTSSDSKVVLIAIANAMDLPERFMRGRIASRLGWDKLVFEPYTSDCLENILKARLGDTLLKKCFANNAIMVATKRIGRTTGDARRILDTCSLALDRAISTGSSQVTAAIIDQVGFQNLDKQRRDYITRCPPLELGILKSILIESSRIGEDNVEEYGVFRRFINLTAKNDILRQYMITPTEYQRLLTTLAAASLIYVESGDKAFFKRKISMKDSGETFKDLIRSQPLSSSA